MSKKINLFLKNLEIKNVIHVGAGVGEYVNFYNDLNIKQLI